MNHTLAIYTVIYVAILFVTVSIWGGNIASATGDTRVLLFALGAFSLKLAIDDYIHFHNAKRERLHADLMLSLIIYLLLAGSIAHSAIGRTRIATIQFAFVFVMGAIWICLSGFSGKKEDRNRRIGWLIVNILAIVFLGWATRLNPQSMYTSASIPLSLLFILIVADFFVFSTLGRLASISVEGGDEVAGEGPPKTGGTETAASQPPPREAVKTECLAKPDLPANQNTSVNAETAKPKDGGSG